MIGAAGDGSSRADAPWPPPPAAPSATPPPAPAAGAMPPYGGIFISHSSHDNAVAGELKEWLAANGFPSAFLDFDPQQGIPAGRSWEQEIYRQMRACAAVLVVYSRSSADSKWCFAEITHARALGKPLFGVRLDDAPIETLLSGVQLTDYRTDRAAAHVRLLEGLRRAGLDDGRDLQFDETRSPYPGLLSFQEQDARLFFGRKAEIAAVIDVLQRSQIGNAKAMQLVLGASGAGKSSLVRAGVVPRCRRDGRRWAVVGPIRPGRDPLGALSAALGTGGAPSVDAEALRTRRGGDNPLLDRARNLRDAPGGAERSLLVVVDQFEELLDPAATHAADTIDLLRDAAEQSEGEVVVLATMRSDFLEPFQQHAALHGFSPGLFPLGPMDDTARLEVIREPAKQAGVDFEPDSLPFTICDDVRSDDGLPLLAFTLHRLYDHGHADGKLTLDEYVAIGGMAGAIVKEADALLAADTLTADQLECARKAFVAMVRLTGDGRWVRRRARWEELDETTHELLRRFVDARLLVMDKDDTGVTVEVAHEALFRSWDRMAAWLDGVRADKELALELENASRAWEKGDRDVADLWPDSRLARIAERPLDITPASLDAQFLAASKAAQEARAAERTRAQRRKLRIAGSIAAGALALAAVSVVFYLQAGVQRNAADREAVRSRGLALIAKARQLAAGGNPALGLALAAEATAVDSVRTQAYQALFEARQAFGARAANPVGPPIDIGFVTVAVDPRGRFVALGGADGVITFLDPRSWEPVGPAIVAVVRGGPPATGGPSPIGNLTFSPDGRLLAAHDPDGLVRFWDVERRTPTGTAIAAMPDPGENHYVTAIAFDPGATMVAVAGTDGMRLWDVATGAPIGAAVVTDFVSDVVFSPDGRVFTAAGRTAVWSWRTADRTPVGPPIPAGGDDLAFTPDGRRVAVATFEDGVRLWNPETAEPDGGPLGSEDGCDGAVAFSPDGSLLALGCSDGSTRLWNVADRTPAGVPLVGGVEAVSSVGFSPDGSLLFVRGGAELRRWNAVAGIAPGAPVPLADAPVTALAFDADGRVGVGTSAGSVHLGPEAALAAAGVGAGGHRGPVLAVAFGTDGLLASVDADGLLRRWGLSGPVATSVARQLAPATIAAFSADGERLVTGDDDGNLRLWDVPTGHPVDAARLDSPVNSLALSADGSTVVAADKLGLSLWRPGSPPRALPDQVDTLVGLAFAGERIVEAGLLDRRVVVLDLDGRAIEIELPRLGSPVDQIAFDSVHHRLATAGEDGTIRLWDRDAPIGVPLQARRGRPRALVFDRDGRRLAHVDSDGRVTLWDLWDVDTACALAEPYLTDSQLRVELGDTPSACHPDKATVRPLPLPPRRPAASRSGG